MSLAPLDQQAGQEMEVSNRFAEGGEKTLLPGTCCSSSGDTGVRSNNSTEEEHRTVSSKKKSKSRGQILLWGRLTWGTKFVLQHIAEAVGFVMYALVDLGYRASLQEESVHCWNNDDLRS